MALNIGILVFDGVEELDFVGPWEVFTMANEVAKHAGKPPYHAVKLIAERARRWFVPRACACCPI